MNPEFALRYQRLAEDSGAMFESLWVPSPRDHLTLPEILPAATRLAMDRSSGLGLLLGGRSDHRGLGDGFHPIGHSRHAGRGDSAALYRAVTLGGRCPRAFAASPGREKF